MSCAYRQAAWREDFNAAITVVISLLTEKFPVVKLLGGRGVVGMVLSSWLLCIWGLAAGSDSVVKLLGGRGAIWMVSSELVGGTSGSCCEQ